MRLWRSESVFIAGLLESVMSEVGWCELWVRDDTEEKPFIPYFLNTRPPRVLGANAEERYKTNNLPILADHAGFAASGARTKRTR